MSDVECRDSVVEYHLGELDNDTWLSKPSELPNYRYYDCLDVIPLIFFENTKVSNFEISTN